MRRLSVRNAPADASRLRVFGLPEIENLHRQLACRSAIVALFDMDGRVLCTAGERGFVSRAMAMDAAQATDMDTEQARRQAQRGESVALCSLTLDQLARNPHLECVTVPVCAPAGGAAGMVGFIDIAESVERPGIGPDHARALLQTTADMIEHRLIESLDSGYLTLRFHDRPTLIDSPFDSMMVFDKAGTLVASNRLARMDLNLGDGFASVFCEACFTIDWPQLVDRAALAQYRPFPLRSVGGHTFSARATLRPLPRPGLPGH